MLHFKHKYYGADFIDWDGISKVKPEIHADSIGELRKKVHEYEDDCEGECIVVLFKATPAGLERMNG